MKNKDFVVGDFVEWSGFYYIIEPADAIPVDGDEAPTSTENFVMSVSPRAGIIVDIEDRGIVAVSEHETILLPNANTSSQTKSTTQISLLSRAS